MTDVDALTSIISALKKLSPEEQQRTLLAVATFLDIKVGVDSHRRDTAWKDSPSTSPREVTAVYSEDRTISPKDFVRDKAPQSDIERVAVLAYYLSNYRDVPHFKTLDISTLNTEAAQPKFSNASVAVDNASKAGFIVQALKGSKQITAAGEHYVQLLPDREAARESIKHVRTRKKVKKQIQKKTTPAPLI
ncbi:hypothetical protein [Xanthomonas arboricola]|uniref:hypothetical protein n=1 Tax=Xanthomonas arboricola TaxID=56448 RepID=UPI0012D3B5BD|nr:hypothetical protein [Xanthomonas arboricola]